MTKISTHNKRRARAHRRVVLAEAFAYHYARCERLERNGRIGDLADSSYNRRWKKHNKDVRRKFGVRVLGTITGRFHYRDPEIQTLTGRFSSNPSLSIPAMPSADYAEIEKRVLAHYRPNDEYANHAAAQWP